MLFRVFEFDWSQFKSAVLSTVIFALIVPITSIFYTLIIGNFINLLNPIKLLKLGYVGIVIALFMSLPSIVKSIARQNKSSSFIKEIIIILSASIFYFAILLFFFKNHPLGYEPSFKSAFFDSLGLTALFIGMHLVLSLPFLKKTRTSP